VKRAVIDRRSHGVAGLLVKHVIRSYGKGTELLVIEGIPMWS
jgi:hypothetical protein